MQCKQIDIYSEVAKRTGKTRAEIKGGCYFLWYTHNGLPENPDDIVEYLVKYFGGDK
tara:strand:+ start:98396 stop:98566 length:171 start_codon:yes stop_codon:yes gene_type:complete